MANKGTFIIDDSVPEKKRDEISDRILQNLGQMKEEIGEREVIINKRQDFFEGRHHKWTNVQGQRMKSQEGHILVVLNYIYRFATKVHQALTNSIPRIKIKASDESDEIETARAEAVEKAISKVLSDNQFYKVVFKRCAINQIRDGDFVLNCKVVKDDEKGKHIAIQQVENLLKVMVGWDDAAGSSFSFIAYSDMWSLAKIKREFNYDADTYSDPTMQSTSTEKGNHNNDQYGLFAGGGTAMSSIPSGKNNLPKGEVVDYWGYEVIDNKTKVINAIYINRELKQFIVTDYKEIPSFVGHSFGTAGKPWSISFIDPLIDPQVELNDRSGEEGDLIRIGAHMKFVAINMPDFDADSIKPGSGQVIFIEGENADFRPLQMTITPFPSAEYINRMLEHMFNIGIPKIALASGTAPYTGRVGAIQYQPFIDLVTDLRIQWEIVLEQMINMIQQYFIDYFPETHAFMREHITDPVTGEVTEGNLIIRNIEFDWENVLPLSRSDKVVDASTLRDRGAISLSTYLEEAGFSNPGEEIKKLKKEVQDADMMTIREKFTQFAPGVVKAQVDAARQQEEARGEAMGQMEQMVEGATPKSTPPLLTPEQNDRRGIPSAGGTPTGQTASLAGNVAQATQNMNAKAGI